MTSDQAKARHAKLAEELRRHDHAYYVLAQPTISDRDYDRLYHELLDLEKEFPALATPDSPSQRVGGTPLKEFLIRLFYQAPQYLGQVANTSLTTEGGARFATVRVVSGGRWTIRVLYCDHARYFGASPSPLLRAAPRADAARSNHDRRGVELGGSTAGRGCNSERSTRCFSKRGPRATRSSTLRPRRRHAPLPERRPRWQLRSAKTRSTSRSKLHVP